MDERLKSLADRGADITIKLRKQNVFIQIRYDRETYKASAGSFEKAADRVLDALKSETNNIKAKRREKEKFRQDTLEQISEQELIDQEMIAEFGGKY
jgi:hypothetical protein